MDNMSTSNGPPVSGPEDVPSIQGLLNLYSTKLESIKVDPGGVDAMNIIIKWIRCSLCSNRLSNEQGEIERDLQVVWDRIFPIDVLPAITYQVEGDESSKVDEPLKFERDNNFEISVAPVSHDRSRLSLPEWNIDDELKSALNEDSSSEDEDIFNDCLLGVTKDQYCPPIKDVEMIDDSQDDVILSENEVMPYDHPLNHSRRQDFVGHTNWQSLRGDRRVIHENEAMQIKKKFEKPQLYNGEWVIPRLLYKINKKQEKGKSEHRFRLATIEEVIKNVGSKKSKKSIQQEKQQHYKVEEKEIYVDEEQKDEDIQCEGNKKRKAVPDQKNESRMNVDEYGVGKDVPSPVSSTVNQYLQVDSKPRLEIWVPSLDRKLHFLQIGEDSGQPRLFRNILAIYRGMLLEVDPMLAINPSQAHHESIDFRLILDSLQTLPIIDYVPNEWQGVLTYGYYRFQYILHDMWWDIIRKKRYERNRTPLLSDTNPSDPSFQDGNTNNWSGYGGAGGMPGRPRGMSGPHWSGSSTSGGGPSVGRRQNNGGQVSGEVVKEETGHFNESESPDDETSSEESAVFVEHSECFADSEDQTLDSAEAVAAVGVPLGNSDEGSRRTNNEDCGVEDIMKRLQRTKLVSDHEAQKTEPTDDKNSDTKKSKHDESEEARSTAPTAATTVDVLSVSLTNAGESEYKERIEKAMKIASVDPTKFAQLVLGYMRANLEDREVQLYGLDLIWRWSKGDKASSQSRSSGNKAIIKAFLDMGVTNDIIVAMNQFKSSRKTNKLSVGAIWALAIDSECTVQLLKGGVVKHMVEAIHLFTSDESIVKHAVGGLQSISVEREARQVLMDWKATDAVTRAMYRHLNSPKISYYSLKYLSNCWINKGSVVEVPEAQMKVVVQAILRHQMQDVTRAGCLALQNSTNNARNTAILRECEGIQHLRALLEQAQAWSKEAAKVLQRLDGKSRKKHGKMQYSMKKFQTRLGSSTLLTTLEESDESDSELKSAATNVVSAGVKATTPNKKKLDAPAIAKTDNGTKLTKQLVIEAETPGVALDKVKARNEKLKQVRTTDSNRKASPVTTSFHSDD